LNLQMTSDIIIYHSMSSDLEKQVIGRGQRLGRSCPLKIHYLCYEHEYSDKEKEQLIVNDSVSEITVNVLTEVATKTATEVVTEVATKAVIEVSPLPESSLIEIPNLVSSEPTTSNVVKKKRGRPRKINSKSINETPHETMNAIVDEPNEEQDLMFELNEIYSEVLDSFD